MNGRISYELKRAGERWGLEFFVAGENLTSAKYEYRPGYPMPRATWMAGLNLKF
jgi:iron complex outermembrane receptor protein